MGAIVDYMACLQRSHEARKLHEIELSRSIRVEPAQDRVALLGRRGDAHLSEGLGKLGGVEGAVAVGVEEQQQTGEATRVGGVVAVVLVWW